MTPVTPESLATSFRTVRVLLDAGETHEAYLAAGALIVHLIDAPMTVRDAALHYARLVAAIAEGAVTYEQSCTPAAGECFGSLGLREIRLRAALTTPVGA